MANAFKFGTGFGAAAAAPAAGGAAAPALGYKPAGFGAFGGAAAGAAAPVSQFGFGQPNAGASAAAAAAAGSTDEVITRLHAMRRTYDRTDPANRFQYIFYNKLTPALAGRVARPAHANPRLWEQGVLNNPSPETLVPCLVVGFEDLDRRIQEQTRARQRYDELLSLLERRVQEMAATQEQELRARIEDALATQAELSHRLMKVMSGVEASRAADLSLNESEVDYRRKLEALFRELGRQGQYKQRIGELAATVRAMQSANGAGDLSGAGIGGAGLPGHLDPASEQQLFTHLDAQREFLERMADDVTLARKDAAVVLKGVDPSMDGLI